MATHSLAGWVDQQSDLINAFRRHEVTGSEELSVPIPPEVTNWIDEQQALSRSCAIGDLSHHMTAVRVEGPDAVAFLKRLTVNDYDDFPVGRAKQIVLCSPDGYLIGDGPMLRLAENTFYGPGVFGTKWLRFQYEEGEEDVDLDIEPPTPLLRGDSPERFVLQVQGPKAIDIMARLTDDPISEIGFFEFAEIELAGREMYALGHGMSPEAGLELIGPFGHTDEIKEAILSAGEPEDARHLGRKAYISQAIRLGWIPPWPKPVYESESTAAYRAWADGDREHDFGKAYYTQGRTLEETFTIEGSFDSDDVTDYYLSPIEVGYGDLIDFDHDFIGRDALRREAAEPARKRVTLVWDEADVTRVSDSIYGERPLHKQFGALPLANRAVFTYDRVERNGELVGLSHGRCYQWDVRGMISVACVDIDHAEPGTEVSVVWGEPEGESPNPTIEDHEPTTIAAEVRPSPYVEKAKA